MTRIGMSDSTNFKFCKDLKEHWEKSHEVKAEIGGSEFIAQWADVYWIDWYDNNIHYLFNWYKEHPDAKKPRFIVRAIDWDVWVRGIRSQEMVDFVDHFVCIAPHILGQVKNEKDDQTGQPIQWNNKLSFIRPGVDLDRFPLKTKKTNGFQVGMVLGDMWWYKNHMGGLDIFAEIARIDKQWHLHIRGQHEPGQYNPIMYNYYLESRRITNRVTLHPHYNDMNEFYDQIDILLHPGMKEAFCYAIAEAAAKGITPVVNDFYGSGNIWHKDWIYRTHVEAVQKILEAQRVFKVFENTVLERYRKWVEYQYPMKTFFEKCDALL